MNPNDFLSMDDFADVLSQLNDLPDVEEDEAALSEEEQASMRRYEEIIMKHRQTPVAEFHEV